jgi:hypothetical protein
MKTLTIFRTPPDETIQALASAWLDGRAPLKTSTFGSIRPIWTMTGCFG